MPEKRAREHIRGQVDLNQASEEELAKVSTRAMTTSLEEAAQSVPVAPFSIGGSGAGALGARAAREGPAKMRRTSDSGKR